MEPRQDEKTTESCSQEKKCRFRIDPLEERIAPCHLGGGPTDDRGGTCGRTGDDYDTTPARGRR